jgi:ATP-binding cassette subfamily B protein/subfamily B ATP-binding cassette protein MsbA
MEPYERRRFCSATKDYCQKSQRVVNIDALASPIIEVLGVATVAGALLAGSYLVLNRHTHLLGLRMSEQPLDAESLLQLYVLLAAIADPVRKLSSVFTRIQSAGAASDRIFAFVDRQPRVKSNSEGTRLTRRLPARPAAPAETRPTSAGRPPAVRPYVEFRNVCFSYDPNRPPILDHVNFGVTAGETIAMVGPNGCGKTTLVGLIPRFYDPNLGSVFIDGHDIRNVHLRSLRQQCGLVTQDAILFADTIYNNIAYGTRGATAEEVESAAKKAHAHDFIARLPKGYQTRLAEAGTKISGGERQRLALARAILRNPSILILDEFTSQMDAENDALIHRTMREFFKDRTTFIVTHRLHTLEIADRIVVLDTGRIAALGTHAELLTGCPLYVRLQEAYSQRLCA